VGHKPCSHLVRGTIFFPLAPWQRCMSFHKNPFAFHISWPQGPPPQIFFGSLPPREPQPFRGAAWAGCFGGGVGRFFRSLQTGFLSLKTDRGLVWHHLMGRFFFFFGETPWGSLKQGGWPVKFLFHVGPQPNGFFPPPITKC